MLFVKELTNYTFHKMIEVVYIPKDGKIFREKLNVDSVMSVADAIKLSGILNLFPEVVDYAVGVFSVKVSQDYLLQPGDRLEIYRSLTLDPKAKRRQRAKN